MQFDYNMKASIILFVIKICSYEVLINLTFAIFVFINLDKSKAYVEMIPNNYSSLIK
jgi:hypothetical protein